MVSVATVQCSAVRPVMQTEQCTNRALSVHYGVSEQCLGQTLQCFAFQPLKCTEEHCSGSWFIVYINMRLYKCRKSPFWPISIRTVRCLATGQGRMDRNNDYPVRSSNRTLKVFSFSHLSSFTIYYTVLITIDASIARSIKADSGEIELSTLSSLPSTIPSTLLPQEIAETPPPIGRHTHLLIQRRNDHIIVRGEEYTKTKALDLRYLTNLLCCTSAESRGKNGRGWCSNGLNTLLRLIGYHKLNEWSTTFGLKSIKAKAYKLVANLLHPLPHRRRKVLSGSISPNVSRNQTSAAMLMPYTVTSLFKRKYINLITGTHATNQNHISLASHTTVWRYLACLLNASECSARLNYCSVYLFLFVITVIANGVQVIVVLDVMHTLRPRSVWDRPTELW